MTQLASLLRKLPGIRRDARRVDVKNGAAAQQSEEQPADDGVRSPSPFRWRRAKSKKQSIPKPEQTGALMEQGYTRADVAPEITSSVLSKLCIPCPDPTLEERTRDEHQNLALKLVRQEDWDKLSKLITEADRDDAMTPGGMSIADLMAFGARADVVLAAEHALFDRTPEHDAPLMLGIEALEFVLADAQNDYTIGCIVAQAHIDMAWAWRGTGWDVEIAPRNREAFDAHFARARDIIQSFNGEPVNSALLASTSCALLRGNNSSPQLVADRYEALIDLNPENTSPFRSLGTHMLPRSYGSYEALELEARRTAARTQGIWGAGGYSWVMFDAISVDDEACALLDLPFFIEGLRDIVTHRPEPATVNLLAAYCANTIGQAFSGNDAADANRAQIADCANWIVREHLTELHPMIWAHAAQGFANNLRIASASRFAAAGHEDAMRIIAGLFKRELAEGNRIVFTDQGPTATPS